MTMPPEQVKAKAYLRERGTEAPVAQIRERVAEAFAAMDTLLDGVTDAQARHQPGGGEWSVHEILDHLVETHPRALEEMRALLENRHSPVSPIPAGLQSAAPLARRWDDLRAELRRLHGLVLEVLAAAPDRLTAARATHRHGDQRTGRRRHREAHALDRGVRLEGLRGDLPPPRARSSRPGEEDPAVPSYLLYGLLSPDFSLGSAGFSIRTD